jgi:hypothetical protein
MMEKTVGLRLDQNGMAAPYRSFSMEFSTGGGFFLSIKICKALDCGLADIMEITYEEEN